MTAEEQIQGGVVMGLSAALGEEITIEAGSVKETNFHQYSLLRMSDAPSVQVAFIASIESPGGLGEPGVPPIAPAVANAWFAATGQRLRQLPLLPAIAAANSAAT
jgi:isoquinoline 1-oxidoreductase beta subunit